jgi:hypothetical protein
VIPGTPIALGDGETVWREYLVTAYPRFVLFGFPITRTEGAGRLYVTNARVIFFATFQHRRRGQSLLIQDTQIQHITGMSSYVAQSYSWLALLTVIVWACLGLLGLSANRLGFAAFFLFLAVAGAMLLKQGLGRRGTVGLRISSGAAQSSPIGFGEMGRSKGGFIRSLLGPYATLLDSIGGPKDAADMLMALPAQDAQQVLVELGALIADLQSKGSLAETHWRRNGDG